MPFEDVLHCRQSNAAGSAPGEERRDLLTQAVAQDVLSAGHGGASWDDIPLSASDRHRETVPLLHRRSGRYSRVAPVSEVCSARCAPDQEKRAPLPDE